MTGAANDRDVLVEPPGVYQVTHDYSTNEPISTTVVSAVAAVSGLSPMALEPLASYIDTDALDQLFPSPARPKVPSDAWLTFRYLGYEVTVLSGGVVRVSSVTAD